MRPRLVFVHGIGGPRDAAAELAAWTGALAAGMRAAGHSAVADGLSNGDVDCRFVHYADLFRPAQAQGSAVGVEDEDSARLLLELLDEVLAGLAGSLPDTSGSEHDAQVTRVLSHARLQTAPQAQEQGTMAGARRALNAATTVLSLRMFRGLGQWTAPKLMVRDLGQVARYVARCEADESGTTLDARIRNRVARELGSSATVLVAHSLGSVVSWETLHEHAPRIRLLVTLGSPLGMRTVVWPRLVPRPQRTPEGVDAWLNFFDHDDPVAVRPRLEEDFGPNSARVLPVSRRVDSVGFWVHPARLYLEQAAVAGPVAEALRAAAATAEER
ncbi:hypothetical protein OIB37_09720 [Streptomyces sp. NBC_00820]|uniref:hypothetical protein n=1 Tax=Streptomyces sp. NBC_00820 TaxID=2975842 RepID=UPI002ED01B0A|nr:hypothetical protein OIB37_09720 [Streptomyces sp. NBC_00820]